MFAGANVTFWLNLKRETVAYFIQCWHVALSYVLCFGDWSISHNALLHVFLCVLSFLKIKLEANYNIVVVFAIHRHESAMGTRVPHPEPPLPPPSLHVLKILKYSRCTEKHTLTHLYVLLLGSLLVRGNQYPKP